MLRTPPAFAQQRDAVETAIEHRRTANSVPKTCRNSHRRAGAAPRSRSGCRYRWSSARRSAPAARRAAAGSDRPPTRPRRAARRPARPGRRTRRRAARAAPRALAPAYRHESPCNLSAEADRRATRRKPRSSSMIKTERVVPSSLAHRFTPPGSSDTAAPIAASSAFGSNGLNSMPQVCDRSRASCSASSRPPVISTVGTVRPASTSRA